MAGIRRRQDDALPALPLQGRSERGLPGVDERAAARVVGRTRIASAPTTPGRRSRGCLRRGWKLASSPECLGCAFVGAAGEFSSSATIPGTALRRSTSEPSLGRLSQLAVQAGSRDPNALAEELLLIMDGAWSAARVFGPDNHGRRAAVAANAIICTSTPPPDD